jgi:hypothetical protein
LFVFCCSADTDTLYDYICVANRNAMTTSIISTSLDEVVATVKINDTTQTTTIPMYCNYYENTNGKILTVGHRGATNSTGGLVGGSVLFFDVENNFNLLQVLHVSFGVFHHWVSVEANQVWILCDGSLVFGTSVPPPSEVAVWVFDLTSYELLAKISFPEDLAELSSHSPATFHDLVVSTDGSWAVVTTYFMPGSNDYAIKYSTTTFEEIGRAAVGSLAHVTWSPATGMLYLISQSSLLYSITVINPEDMSIISAAAGSAGAHMIVGPGVDGKTFYVTNLPSGGIDGLFGFDTSTGYINSAVTVDTVYNTPHNLAFNYAKTKLYLTHSGANVVTTVWDISNQYNPRPQYVKAITTGSNPYGIFNFQSTVKIGVTSQNPSSGNQLSACVALVVCLFGLVIR